MKQDQLCSSYFSGSNRAAVSCISLPKLWSEQLAGLIAGAIGFAPLTVFFPVRLAASCLSTATVSICFPENIHKSNFAASCRQHWLYSKWANLHHNPECKKGTGAPGLTDSWCVARCRSRCTLCRRRFPCGPGGGASCRASMSSAGSSPSPPPSALWKESMQTLATTPPSRPPTAAEALRDAQSKRMQWLTFR